MNEWCWSFTRWIQLYYIIKQEGISFMHVYQLFSANVFLFYYIIYKGSGMKTELLISNFFSEKRCKIKSLIINYVLMLCSERLISIGVHWILLALLHSTLRAPLITSQWSTSEVAASVLSCSWQVMWSRTITRVLLLHSFNWLPNI